MCKKARIDELLQGRDSNPDRTKINRPVQLAIPLQIDQGGEDVED